MKVRQLVRRRPIAAPNPGRRRGRVHGLVVAWCLTSVLVGVSAARYTLRLERENQQLRVDAASYRRASASADERLWNCRGLVDNLTATEPEAPLRRPIRPSRRRLTLATTKALGGSAGLRVDRHAVVGAGAFR